LLAVALVFGQTLGHGFVSFDDNGYVYENPHVKSGLSLEGVAWAFTHSYEANWHPLTWLSHMLDCQLYDLKPWGHHLSNVLLHAAAAILLFLVLRRMTGRLWPSALVAAVFAVHPLRVESVAWVAERKDVLSGLFFMLTLAAYGRYVRRPSSLGRYLLVMLLFALGLLAKPMLVTVPFVLLLLDYWPLRRWNPSSAGSVPRPCSAWCPGTSSAGTVPGALLLRSSGTPLRLVLEKLPLLALAAASCVATLLAQAGAIVSVAHVPMRWRIANALVSYVAYLGQFFYPAGLAPLYPHPEGAVAAWKVIGALLAITGITAAVLAWRRRFPCLLVGWLWYLGMLLPVIGLVQVGVQAMADRYTYLPQIGLVLALAWGVADVARDWRCPRWICGVAASLVLLLLAGCAWRQTSYWRDTITLWTRTLDCTSRNSAAQNNLGGALYWQGRFNEAAAHFQTALEIRPDFAEAHNGLGSALLVCGHVNEAIAEFQTAVGLDPDFALAQNNLGGALARCGRFAEAIPHFRKAVETKPDYADAHYNLGLVLVDCGRADEAIAEFRTALRFKPDDAEVHNSLGSVLAGRGRITEAIAEFQKALKVDPDLADAHANLGSALAQEGDSRGAAAQWREALRLQPDDVAVLNRLAWLLATHPDGAVRNGAEAIGLARRAARLSGGRDPAILDTLAAAYAEAGRFPEAVETAQQALSLAAAAGNWPLADALRSRLGLYGTGSAFRQAQPPPSAR
jgi:tetratricopeptide (TPR) repeat protein